ncbi:ISNCY family transposase ISMags1 [subsurface metagenome]
MRFVVEPQMKLGADIDEIEFDLRSRDEIPKLLIGLHHIYTTPEIREKVFEILKDIVPVGVDPANGRPGMELWKILVLGTLRLNCNWDYDKLQEIANHHDTVRQMLGHGVEDDAEKYALQTLKDNVSLFTPEVLDKINKVVVKEGHKVVG